MSKVAISQSNYIPWKGYFDLIQKADFFVLMDSVQYTRRDWRNRNKIVGVNGELMWLTIPVKTKGKFTAQINEIETANDEWRLDHFKAIHHSYKHTPHFKKIIPVFEELYLNYFDIKLSSINRKFIESICALLEINTKLVSSLAYPNAATANQKLLLECKRFDTKIYISGPSASSYLDIHEFNKAGVDVEWMNYDGYPQYHQNTAEFEPFVSIIDLLFNHGFDSKKYLLKTGLD